MTILAKQCLRCLYKSDHPLGLLINSNGICSGCLIHEEKNTLDWEERRSKLIGIVGDYKLRNATNYDCIVPVTGGQDTYFIVHTVINILGLNPLLVNFNRNFNSAIGIRNLANLRSLFPADFRQYTINPVIARKVVRTTLANLGTINWLSIAGQTSLPVRMATELKIPLIIWGAHQGIEQVGMFSHLDEVEMTSRYRKEHDLMGIDEKNIFQFDPDFKLSDIKSLQYPEDSDLRKNQTRGIYLGNYFRWDPVEQHKFVANNYGYLGRSSNRTYYEFDNPDCPVYNEFQDFMKYQKLGYGKVADQLTREIRHGRISLDKARKIAEKYSRRNPKDVSGFADWLGISSNSLNTIMLSHSSNFASQIKGEGWRSDGLQGKKYISSLKTTKGNYIDSDFTNIGKGI